MCPDAGCAKISFRRTFEACQFFRLLGRVRKSVDSYEGLHQSLAYFCNIRRFLGGFLEPVDFFLCSTKPHFPVTQFAAQYWIVPRESYGVTVSCPGFQQTSEVVKRISPEMLAQRP